MWFLLVMRWLLLCLFVWFMIYEVFVPMWNKQPLFPAIREFFRDNEKVPAKADNTTKVAQPKQERGNDE